MSDVYLKYYDEENALWPEWDAARCSPDEAVAAIRKLEHHFRLCHANGTHIRVDFTKYGCSYASRWDITLSERDLSWLTIAHEFAHSWLEHLRSMYVEPPGRHHCKAHRRLVGLVLAYIAKMQWHQGGLSTRKIKRYKVNGNGG